MSDGDAEKSEAERRAIDVARRATEPAAQALAADSAANEALAIAKVPPPPVRTGATLAVFVAGTVIIAVGFATGLEAIACVGAAMMAACIQRLSSSSR